MRFEQVFGENGDVYRVVTLLGLILGAWFWSLRWKKRPGSFAVFLGAILGAFLGAKILFLLAEGWLYFGEPGWIVPILSGKTIIGALLGGYGGVEIAKKLVGHRDATGDWFAIGVPLSIAMGRVGCLRFGCCLGEPCERREWWAQADLAGIARWPAVPLELLFNLLFLAAILPVVIRGAGKGQLFHWYLLSYGIFRFWHEFHRATPKWFGEVSGYQVGAAALVILALVRMRQRSLENEMPS